MFCSQCGKPFENEDAKFCSHCGAPVQGGGPETQDVQKTPEIQDAQESGTPKISDQMAQMQSVAENKKPPKWVLLPLATLLILAIIVGLQFYLEIAINQSITADYQKSAQLIQEGNYSAALILHDKILSKRPGFENAKQSRAIVAKGAEAMAQLDGIDQFLKNGKISEAQKALKTGLEKVDATKHGYFNAVSETAEKKQTRIDIYIIKGEIDTLTTVEQLGEKLEKLKDKTGEEAVELQKTLKEKIDAMVAQVVEHELEASNFSKAAKEIDKAQIYSDSSELVMLKERVLLARKNYEESEAQRMEEAINLQEEAHAVNKTQAVVLTSLKAVLDPYGDVVINGSVRNNGTRGIYNITVEFDVYDSNETYMTTGSTFIFPNHLAPGEEGYFENYLYDVNRDVTVTVTNATWYID